MLELYPQYADVGREFTQFDSFEAFSTADQTNLIKTAGAVLSFPIDFKSDLDATQMLLQDITILHSHYILSAMEVSYLCGEPINTLSFLKKSAENYLL